MICNVCQINNVDQKHHITYFPEETIGVCDPCHRWIHSKLNEKQLFIKYPKGDSKIFYSQQKRIKQILYRVGRRKF